MEPALLKNPFFQLHYNDVIMGAMASQITSLMIVYVNRLFRHRSNKTSNSASLAYVRGIHQWPVNSPYKRPITRKKMFPFHDVIMKGCSLIKAPVTQNSTSKSRTRSYENLLDVVVSGNFWSILAWPCFVTGYGRRRLLHDWSTA